MSKWKKVQGFMAWVGVWLCMCLVGEFVLELETFSFIMLWGAFAFWLSDKTEKWIMGIHVLTITTWRNRGN